MKKKNPETNREQLLHNNYYFLRQLSLSLEKILPGAVVSECFSQEKDELILRFETASGSFYLKASALPDFSCLSFPSGFNRARRNSVDLFGAIIGQRVSGIRQFSNERSFCIRFGDLSLLFKMHGNRSNVLLFGKDGLMELFRNNIAADRNIRLESLDREIDWSFEAFRENLGDLRAHYFTFGKIVWQYLSRHHFESLPVDQQWQAIRQIIAALENPVYYITQVERKPVLSLLRFGDIRNEWSDALKALNEFYYIRTQEYAVAHLKSSLASDLRARLASSRSYCLKNREKLRELRQDDNYKEWADLIMANLHVIKPNADKITLENFFRGNEPVEIRLKRDLSPQKNAELYYRKSKNQHLETSRIESSISAKEGDIRMLEGLLQEVLAADDFKSLKRLQSEAFAASRAKDDKPSLPYHEFIHAGFRIWVGKNAQSNDILTLKLAHKEDLWLHTKDVAGSHVVIRHQPGKNFPKDVIERAAQLAAYNSKRKNETLCPVIVTPKKFVRKRKGDPAGMVVVEREKVIMVEPKLGV